MKLASLLSGGHAELDPGQFNAAQQIATRIYEVANGSKANGKTALAIDKEISKASVEAIYREGKTLDLTDTTTIQVGDRVAITGAVDVMETAFSLLGREIVAPNGLLLVQENREIILTNRALNSREDRRDPRACKNRNPSRRIFDSGQAHGARPSGARQAAA